MFATNLLWNLSHSRLQTAFYFSTRLIKCSSNGRVRIKCLANEFLMTKVESRDVSKRTTNWPRCSLPNTSTSEQSSLTSILSQQMAPSFVISIWAKSILARGNKPEKNNVITPVLSLATSMLYSSWASWHNLNSSFIFSYGLGSIYIRGLKCANSGSDSSLTLWTIFFHLRKFMAPLLDSYAQKTSANDSVLSKLIWPFLKPTAVC